MGGEPGTVGGGTWDDGWGNLGQWVENLGRWVGNLGQWVGNLGRWGTVGGETWGGSLEKRGNRIGVE